MKPGTSAYADLYGTWWLVRILSKPRNRNVLFAWLAGPLKGKEARRATKTLRREGEAR